MIFYHVSTHRKDGDILDPNIKMSLMYRKSKKTNKMIYDPLFNAYQKGFNNFVAYYNEFRNSNILEETGRRPSKWLCEVIFELARQENDLCLPSRLRGVFLCDCYEDDMQFGNSNRQNGSIYSVTIPDDDYKCFNMDLFQEAEVLINDKGLDENTFEDVLKIAKSYWKGCEKSCPSREYIYDAGSVKLSVL